MFLIMINASQFQIVLMISFITKQQIYVTIVLLDVQRALAVFIALNVIFLNIK